MARAYRFHNVVALNVEGATVYIPAPEAIRLAKALTAAGRSIGRETFAASNVSGPEIADYGFAPDAHNVAAAIAAGQIRVREMSPGHWRAFYRADKVARWRTVKSSYGPIDYKSLRAAYAAAYCERGRLAHG